MSTTHEGRNEVWRRRLEEILREVLAETLRRGFFGAAVLEVSIQDGTVQHARRRVERLER